MRIKRKSAGLTEGDMTPMIDMTFQLIAFFMVLINFTESEQDQRINLPTSQLAVPPEGQIESPITLQLSDEGTVYIAGEVVKIQGMRPYLLRERDLLENNDKTPADATVIIRADAQVEGGHVQELIRLCQDVSFEHFVLRVEEDDGTGL